VVTNDPTLWNYVWVVKLVLETKLIIWSELPCGSGDEFRRNPLNGLFRICFAAGELGKKSKSLIKEHRWDLRSLTGIGTNRGLIGTIIGPYNIWIYIIIIGFIDSGKMGMRFLRAADLKRNVRVDAAALDELVESSRVAGPFGILHLPA